MSAGQLQKLAHELRLTEIHQSESVPLCKPYSTFLSNFVYTEVKFTYSKNCFHNRCKSLLIKALATHGFRVN